MFRRFQKNQNPAISPESRKQQEDQAFASNLRELGLLGEPRKPSSKRPKTGTSTGSHSFADVPTYPEKGTASILHFDCY